MIRKVIIVLLTLGAVGTVVAFILSTKFVFGYSSTPFTVGLAHGALNIGYSVVVDMGDSFIEPKDPLFSGVPLNWLPFIIHTERFCILRIPLWMMFILMAAYPTLAFIRGPVRRHRRRKRGLCVKCAYNLTGNVSGTCPECGTKVTQP